LGRIIFDLLPAKIAPIFEVATAKQRHANLVTISQLLQLIFKDWLLRLVSNQQPSG
jgi:hypothetical protein